MSDSTDNEEGLELLEGGGNRSKLLFLPFGPRWRKRALKTFNGAWRNSKGTVVWSIFKLTIKVVMVYTTSVILCTMDTVSDFALSVKYFK